MKIMKTDKLHLFLGLTIGTIIQIEVTELAKPPNLIYLNTALFKFTINSNNLLIYTDGLSLWKADNILANEKDIKFHQLITKNVKDFAKCGDHLVSTTYTNMIYTLAIDDDLSYSNAATEDEYCSAETVLSNSEYFYRILKEMELGKEWSKRVIEEESYVTALALSRRQDIMDKSIHSSVTVYENYDDAVKEHDEVTLTEEIKNYFEPNTICFLIKITACIIHHSFNDILSNIFGDIKIHINLLSEDRVLKTTSIRLNELLKKLHVLIPLNAKYISNTPKVYVDIKLVTDIPGAFDKNQHNWTLLCRKTEELSSEHLIRTNTPNKYKSLKESDESINNLILKSALSHHGNLFSFSDLSEHRTFTERNFFVRLPTNFVELFKNQASYSVHRLSSSIRKYLMEQFMSEEFLNSKTELCINIANEEVKLEIVNDFCNPMLKIRSNNIKKGFNIRNFIANFVYNSFKNCSANTEYVNHTLYTTVENLKKSIKNCISDGSQDQLLELAEQFQKNVIGGLPM